MSRKGLHFSGENHDVESIASLYQTNVEAAKCYKRYIMNLLRAPGNYMLAPSLNTFFRMSAEEINEHFDLLQKELDTSFSLTVIAAIEAKFRMDYIVRVNVRFKDNLSREFRNVYSEHGENARLKSDLLAIWKECYPQYKALLSGFIQCLNYRNWLAHGRYWVPKIGRQYDFSMIYELCKDIEDSLPLKKGL